MTVLRESAGRCQADVGEPVVLRLGENPGTGYRWEVTASDGLELVGDVVVQVGEPETYQR